MKLKKVGAICNAGGCYYLINQTDADGENVYQWLGDGRSAYPLVGLPVMDVENICAMFDITEKKREKLIMRQMDAPDTMNWEDTDPLERQIGDNGPSVDTVTLNVLAAADDVLIPIRPDEFSFSGLLDLVEQVDAVRAAVNPGLTLRGAFFTHWQNRETFWQARRSLEDSGICPVFQTAINYNPKVPESTLEEKPLCAFAPRSWAAIQYKKLTAEYLALTDSGKGKEG